MAKIVRANLELASVKVCSHIADIDAQSVSSRPTSYVEDNLLGYYVAINTWLMLIQQWSRFGWTYVLDYMSRFGLFQTIREFDTAAAQLIKGEDPTFGLARTLLRDIHGVAHITGVPTDDDKTIHRNPLSAALTIFRYLKRFSPLDADILRQASIDDFIDRQKYLKQQQRTPRSRFVEAEVKDAITSLVDWKSVCDELDRFDITDLEFTGGVSFDTSAPLMSKLRRVAKDRVEYFPIPFGIPLVAHSEANPVRYWGKYGTFEYHTVRISAVPKNYKTARIIAPEDVVRQATARRYFTIMDRYLPATIKLHDQSQNQTYAHIGSIDGKFATLDLSAASDSITATDLALFPNRFVSKMVEVLPTHFEYEGKIRRLESAATMGNSVTFWLESVLFAGIALAGVRFYNRFSGATDETISVYGDDIIVPTDAASTVIEFLEELGFVVNHDKSFFDPDMRYRESCGEEYLDGVCVSSIYFPRFPLCGKIGGKFGSQVFRDTYRGSVISTMTAMVDLQHKLFTLCEPASVLLSQLISEADPRMTSSTPDEGKQDIWSYESTPVTLYAPYVERDTDGRLKKVRNPDDVHDGHSTPITRFTGEEKEDVLYDLYKYLQFLKYGPRYDTELDRLLGISSAPQPYKAVSAKTEVEWRYLW
jgi:hypothetical protein